MLSFGRLRSNGLPCLAIPACKDSIFDYRGAEGVDCLWSLAAAVVGDDKKEKKGVPFVEVFAWDPTGTQLWVTNTCASPACIAAARSALSVHMARRR
jgi:hypothetical protein